MFTLISIPDISCLFGSMIGVTERIQQLALLVEVSCFSNILGYTIHYIIEIHI